LESALHTETSQLQRELANCRLDLDDAQNSRRNFQQQVQVLDGTIQQLKKENDDHRVCGGGNNKRGRRIYSEDRGRGEEKHGINQEYTLTG
jgi:hypothetical protein